MDGSDGKAIKVTLDAGGGSGAAHVAVSGRIGIEEANELQRRFEDIFRAGRPWIILSLSDVDFMCSAAMGTLLSGVGEARKAGGEIIFTDISPKAKTIFEFLDVWDYITTAADRETALKMVGTGKRMQGRTAAPAATASADEVRARLVEGVALSKGGKLKEALVYFNAVLQIDRDSVPALTWKGNVLERLGQIGEARRLYVRVGELDRGDPKLVAYARDRLRIINTKLQISDEVMRAREQLRSAALDIPGPSEEIRSFLTPERTTAAVDFPMWESFRTWYDGPPFGEEATGFTLGRGGGYYLWAGGKGVVVDPGRNFLSHFAAAGRRLADIDAVVVTTDSSDHSADLETLFDAFVYAAALGVATGAPKQAEVYLSGGAYRRYHPLLNQYKDALAPVAILKPGRSFKFGEISLEVKPAVGRAEPRDEDPVGFVLTGGEINFGYLAETVGEPETLAPHYRGLRGHLFLAHVGGVYEDNDPRVRWAGRHLGYEGVTDILAEIRPALALLTEIWNVREPGALVGAITKATRCRCLPVDIGFKVNLATSQIICGDAEVPAADIRVSLFGGGRIHYRTAA